MVQIGDHEVGKLGYGLMGLTIQATPMPDEVAFALLRRAIDLGYTFWNSGTFYGRPDPAAGLKLLNRFFTKYPNDRGKVFLSVKGCFTMMPMKLDASAAGCRESVLFCVENLNTYVDLFEPARVDPAVPIEETMTELAKLVDEGLIKSIGLSECSAATIRRAAKIHAVSAVEQEYSLWSTEIEHNEILSTCAELKIPIIAYSPLSRGFLGAKLKEMQDLPENDIRRMMPRYSAENFAKNVELASTVEEFALSKGITSAQLSIAWVFAQGPRYGVEILPIPGTSSMARLEENAASKDVAFTQDELSQLRELMADNGVSGPRYAQAHSALLFGDTPELK